MGLLERLGFLKLCEANIRDDTGSHRAWTERRPDPRERGADQIVGSLLNQSRNVRAAETQFPVKQGNIIRESHHAAVQYHVSLFELSVSRASKTTSVILTHFIYFYIHR